MSLFQPYELDLDPGEKDTIEANTQPGYWHVYPRASIGSGGVRLCNGPSIKAEGSHEIVGLMAIRLPGRDTKITLENRSSAAVHLFITAARGFHISVERLDPGSGGGGASTFLDLTDSPASYSGQASKRASVKSAEDGLEFTAEPAHAFPDLTDSPASYSGQAGKVAAVKATEDGLEFIVGGGGYTEGARAYNSGNHVIPNTTMTSLTFDSESYDTDDIHSTVSNTSRLLCKTAGVYAIECHAKGSGATAGVLYLDVFLNNATILCTHDADPTANTVPRVSFGTQFLLAVGDYIEFRVWQNSGSNMNIVAEGISSPAFMMQRIG